GGVDVICVIGHLVSKPKEFATAKAKASEDAKKNLIRIPLNKATLPHQQKGKYGGARVYIQPASRGTGVIAGGAVRAVLESVGVQDVLSKSQRSEERRVGKQCRSCRLQYCVTHANSL